MNWRSSFDLELENPHSFPLLPAVCCSCNVGQGLRCWAHSPEGRFRSMSSDDTPWLVLSDDLYWAWEITEPAQPWDVPLFSLWGYNLPHGWAWVLEIHIFFLFFYFFGAIRLYFESEKKNVWWFRAFSHDFSLYVEKIQIVCSITLFYEGYPEIIMDKKVR